MRQIPYLFMRNPGGENEEVGGNVDPQKEEAKPEDSQDPKTEKDQKGFFGKIKAALQEWSTVDEQEQEEDNSSPIT